METHGFDPNLLFSKETFNVDEHKAILAAIRIFKQYYPMFSSKHKDTLLRFHASAHLASSAHIAFLCRLWNFQLHDLSNP